MHRDVDVIAVPRVHIYSMEAGTGTIDDLESLSFLYCQVDQKRAMRQVGEGLWEREGLRAHRWSSQTLDQCGGLRLGLP